MKRFWQVSTVLALLFALGANFAVATQKLDVPSINSVSDAYATLLTPADYAFGIWSVIYLFLVLFAVYQARDFVRPRKANSLPQKAGPLFVIASICNGVWTYIFVQDMIGLSVAILLVLTVSLYILLWRLKIALYDAPLATIVCVWWPLLLYTGWVTVACLVNIASWGAARGFAPTPLAACSILFGLMFGLLALLATRNVRELLLASAWGIAAIGVRQVQLQGSGAVAATAFVVSGILLLAVARHAYQNRATNPLVRLIK